MTGSGQLGPLVALRWRMVRSGRARWGFLMLAAAVPLLCLLAVAVALTAPRDSSSDVTVLAPTAYLSVALLAVLAPLVAGGGNELFPPDQLVAFPVTARTEYAASLALTPLNLAWTSQLIALVGFTSYIAGPTALLPLALLTCLAYIMFVTLSGQALAWAVVGFRQTRHGRQVTWLLAGLLVAVATGFLLLGDVGAALAHAPTTRVVSAAVAGAEGNLGDWWETTVALLALSVVTNHVGRELCTWALRQPGITTGPMAVRQVRRRRAAGGARDELLAVDRASVWRSQSLRRGLLVLGTLPGLAAAAAGLSWNSLVLLPGLVAAGAGLLFGVNAFSLDGSGALWLASLPRRPAVAFWCKTQVVAETCAVAVGITVLAGSLRTGRLPTASEAAAVGACSVVALLRVVATCMELSISRPHRADLRGPRDTPAPPGSMAAYSARMAISTTLVAVCFSGLAEVGTWGWSVLVAVPLCLLSVRRLFRSARHWQDVRLRARVVSVVASG